MKCPSEDCRTRAMFNFPGEKKGLYCRKHALNEMIDVTHSTCIYCNKRPIFNYPGEKRAILCSVHKEDIMVNVIDRKCLMCDKIPSFNFYGEKTVFCADHKENGMVNVKHKKCTMCGKRPHFNYPGEKTPQFCSDHKDDKMIDIKHKKCTHCNKQPQFNYPGEKSPQFCYEHKDDKMIDITHRKCTMCDKRPHFNYPGEKSPLLCADHKKPKMTDVSHPKCRLEHCDIRSNPKYSGYCFRCFIYTFPDSHLSRNYKTKENAVASFIQESFPQYDITYDQRVPNSCSRRRPDILIHFGNWILIIEVDENQHQDYDTTCEQKRTNDLYEDLGYHPITFIHFNPDSYTDATRKKHKSCWTFTPKTGILKISLPKVWEQRLKTLYETIQRLITTNETLDATSSVQIINLFYTE